MHIHYLQHVPFEGPGSIETWAITHGHTLSVTRLYAGDQLPTLERFDLLVILGGPMSVHDEFEHVWLKAEKWFVRQVIDAGKPILGICLGAQLLAQLLGGEVVAAAIREIGWYPVKLTEELSASDFGQRLPATLEAFHWHGETFSLPEAVIPIGSSKHCANQGFIYNDRVIALQFHLETTQVSAESLIENSRNEMQGEGAIQSEQAILADPLRFEAANRTMSIFMEHLMELAQQPPEVLG